MDLDSACYGMFLDLYKTNENFKNIIDENMSNGKIRFFSDEEWDKIKFQNFVSPIKEMNEFIDMFRLGLNIGNCIGASRQLSYSYKDVDIVSGVLPLIKGTLNAEVEGGHGWLERRGKIIDTSLCLVIDNSLKDEIGYIEEHRLTKEMLRKDPVYCAKREWTLDHSLKTKR